MAKNLKDLSGRIFGNLKVISRAPDKILPCGKHVVMWNCECKCGNTCVVQGGNLKSGLTNSCGCRRGNKKIISWHLVSPSGKEYLIDNLHAWLRGNCQKLFECEPDSKEMYRIYVGIAKAKENYFATESGKGIYKGWQIVPTEDDFKNRGKPTRVKMKEDKIPKERKVTKNQQIIYAMYEGGMKQSQIARELGCSRQNVSETIKRAKQRLEDSKPEDQKKQQIDNLRDQTKCPICGKSLGRNKICCSSKCYAEYRQHYSTCPICGKQFKHSPSDTTTHTCGKRECARAYRSIMMTGKSCPWVADAIKTNPNTGHFETHHNAETWNLIAPNGEEYEFKNLHLWVEEHAELLPVSNKTGKRVSAKTFEREIIRLKGTKNGKESKPAIYNDYYGWTLQ